MNVTFCFKERLLAKNEKYALSYYKGHLILRDSNFSLIKKIRIVSVFKSLSIIERMMRIGPKIAVSISDDRFLFSNHGSIFLFDADKFELSETHRFAKGMNNPLSFCVIKNEKNIVEEVLYGEYIWNEDKGPVSIYKYDMKDWKLVYTFPENTIKHIHNITYDKYKNRFLILTGDDDKESVIWEADMSFSNVKKIVGGKQMYRSCVCFPTKKGVYYATDTPLEANHIYKLNEDKNVDEISEISGPCIYGVEKNDKLYIATSVEGDSTLSKIRYRLSNKLGNGVKDRYVHLLCLSSDGNLQEITKIKKDILPFWLFQFGNALFPDSYDDIYFVTQSTKKKGTYKIERE